MEINNELPWIIFELNQQLYAVNTRLVTGIIQFPAITFVPEAPEMFLGVANVRGEVIPILDLCSLLRLKTDKDESEQIIKILSDGKIEQEKWLEEFRRCAKTGEKFTLETDSRQSSFGKWYYNYHSNNQTVSLLLKELETPFREMYECGEKNARNASDAGNAKLVLRQAELYGKSVLRIIDKTVEYIKESLTRMVITLSDVPASQIPKMGFAVDNIKGVDELKVIDERRSGQCLFMSNHIYGVAHSEKFSGEILISDDNEILKTVKIFKDSVKNKKK